MTDYQKYSLIAVRLGLGLLFLNAGLNKLLNDFTAAGFLENATSGPFQDIFLQMAGSPIVDFLVIYGEILIGLALILGIFIRFTSIMGSLMMFLFYIAVLPPENSWVNQNIMYILVFAVLATFGAGRYLGIDSYIESLSIVENNKYLRYFLG